MKEQQYNLINLKKDFQLNATDYNNLESLLLDPNKEFGDTLDITEINMIEGI